MPREHRVRQGEDIANIADRYGFMPETIWDDPANAELKRRRTDPNVLNPGDRLTIPDLRLSEESCASGQTHRFRKKGTARLRLRFMDDDEPMSGVAYVLDVDGRTREGQTDGDGWLDEPLPPRARKGMLYLGDQRRAIPLNFATVDPVNEVRGAQARLKNLGLFPGRLSGRLDTETQEALRGFQRRAGIDESGELDQATQDALTTQHGG